MTMIASTLLRNFVFDFNCNIYVSAILKIRAAYDLYFGF